jgi:hypothetical protein
VPKRGDVNYYKRKQKVGRQGRSDGKKLREERMNKEGRHGREREKRRRITRSKEDCGRYGGR